MKGWIHIGIALVGLWMLSGCFAKPAEPYGADLVVTTSADRSLVRIGESFTLTLTLTNRGPRHASGIVCGNPLLLPNSLLLIQVERTIPHRCPYRCS